MHIINYAFLKYAIVHQTVWYDVRYITYIHKKGYAVACAAAIRFELTAIGSKSEYNVLSRFTPYSGAGGTSTSVTPEIVTPEAVTALTVTACNCCCCCCCCCLSANGASSVVSRLLSELLQLILRLLGVANAAAASAAARLASRLSLSFSALCRCCAQ
jgi:hypothetical protein